MKPDLFTCSEPFWACREGTRKNLVCILKDVANGYDNGAPTTIDASIAPLVAVLNENGLTTLFSCSGLARDHAKPAYCRPYIAFAHRLPKSLVSLLPDGLVFENDDCLRMAAETTDEQRVAIWRAFESAVAIWIAN